MRVRNQATAGAVGGGPRVVLVLIHALVPGELHPLGPQLVHAGVQVVELPAEAPCYPVSSLACTSVTRR